MAVAGATGNAFRGQCGTEVRFADLQSVEIQLQAQEPVGGFGIRNLPTDRHGRRLGQTFPDPLDRGPTPRHDARELP